MYPFRQINVPLEVHVPQLEVHVPQFGNPWTILYRDSCAPQLLAHTCRQLKRR